MDGWHNQLNGHEFDQTPGDLKGREVTLPTKVHMVKAVVSPVVLYACESWTIKKAEC